MANLRKNDVYFALIRGIPKNKDNNKTYYKEGLKDSLFSSYILYIY